MREGEIKIENADMSNENIHLIHFFHISIYYYLDMEKDRV